MNDVKIKKKSNFSTIISLLGNPKIAFDFHTIAEPYDIAADGMSIDRNGNLWVGLIRAGLIAEIDPK